MDFIRHDARVFNENKGFDITLAKYTQLVSEIATIKKKHNCFHVTKPKYSDRFYGQITRAKPQRPAIIKKTEESYTLFLRSSLNKLTHGNFERIYTVLQMKATDAHIEETLHAILNIASESVLFTELYVGMVLNLFLSTKHKNDIIGIIHNYFADIFQEDFYSMSNEISGESYDEFCERVKSKKQVLQKLKTFFFLLQDADMAFFIEKTPNQVFEIIFKSFEKLNLNTANEQSLEQLVNCLIQCTTPYPSLTIPLVTSPSILWSPSLTFTNTQIDAFVASIEDYRCNHCSSNKLKFKCLDLVNLIQPLKQ